MRSKGSEIAMNNSFTAEELAIAKSVDLVAVASSLGYSPKKIGNYYTLKEMDSIRIYNRSHWCRFSRRYEKGNCGGSQIDFLRVFAGMEIKEAVFWLLDFAGYRRMDKDQNKPTLRYQVAKEETKSKNIFELPAQEGSNHYLYEYLTKERAISRDVVDYFLGQGLIYESRHYHNIVFKGNDVNGKTRFASMRGVFDRQGKPFKCDVRGNDKRYGFNIVHEQSDEVIVFEAAIDLMSYMDIYRDFETNMLALGMVADAPLETFLGEHPNITEIKFCLDRDQAGREATDKFMKKYYERGYEVTDAPPPEGYKDYNEWLVNAKLKNVPLSLEEKMTLKRC